jgi:transposase InsO family protein
MLRVLQASKAGYYAWRKRERSARARRDAELVIHIKEIHARSRRTYGSPRIHRALREKGIYCSRKRVARLMHEAGVEVKRRKAFRRTTNSKHQHPIAANVLDRRFVPRNIGAPNVAWAGDISVLQQHRKETQNEIELTTVQEAA